MPSRIRYSNRRKQVTRRRRWHPWLVKKGRSGYGTARRGRLSDLLQLKKDGDMLDELIAAMEAADEKEKPSSISLVKTPKGPGPVPPIIREILHGVNINHQPRPEKDPPSLLDTIAADAIKEGAKQVAIYGGGLLGPEIGRAIESSGAASSFADWVGSHWSSAEVDLRGYMLSDPDGQLQAARESRHQHDLNAGREAMLEHSRTQHAREAAGYLGDVYWPDVEP